MMPEDPPGSIMLAINLPFAASSVNAVKDELVLMTTSVSSPLGSTTLR